MPAKSRAEQQLMAIAEHHPSEVSAKNRGVLKMSHRQLHDFAVGSEAGKPVHVPKPRTLHPALAARAAAVKIAHAHLSATVPGFRSKPPAEQFSHTQRHIRTKLTRKG